MAKKFNNVTMCFEDEEEKSSSKQKQQSSSYSTRAVVNKNNNISSSSSQTSYNQSHSSLNPTLDKICAAFFWLSFISLFVGFFGGYFVKEEYWLFIWVAIGVVLFGIGLLILHFA